MRKVKHLLVAGVLVLAAALSGCANDPGVFATVNGKQIPVSDYENMFNVIFDTSEEKTKQYILDNPGRTHMDTTYTLIIEAVIPDLYAACGVTYDPDAIDKQYEDSVNALKEEDERERMKNPYIARIYKAGTSYSQLIEEVRQFPVCLINALYKQDIQLNPRFGEFVVTSQGGTIKDASLSTTTHQSLGSLSEVELDEGK